MAATASCSARLSAIHCTPLEKLHRVRANDGGVLASQRCAMRAPVCSNLYHSRFLGTRAVAKSFLSGRPVLQETLQKGVVPSSRKRAIEAKSGNKREAPQSLLLEFCCVAAAHPAKELDCLLCQR